MTTTSQPQRAAEKKWQRAAWDLSELLPEPSRAGLDKALKALGEKVEDFEARRPGLASIDSTGVLDLVHRYTSIVEGVHLAASYGSLLFAADTQSEEALALVNRAEQRLTALQNRLLFFPLWWKALTDEEADSLMPWGEGVEDEAFFLSEQRRFRDYSLDEGREQVINLKDADGISGLLTVYSMLTNRLEFEIEVSGEARRLTRDELMAHVLSADADVREAAYREFFRVFEAEAAILGQIYVHRVRDWHNEQIGLRGYPSAIAVRNIANDVPQQAVEQLLECAQRNVGLFQRYFRLKAGWLGQETLRRYDLYAPLTASDQTVDYATAVDSVLETFEDFHPDFAAAARRVFEHGHIDSEIRRGKKSGAFCATVTPALTPWVLVNYAGRLRDVATLAHELGHAVHSVLASDHSILTQHASLPLAETASVFAEMLMTDRLLDQQEDPLARRELLASALDDIYATVLRQSFFVLFELEAHEAILQDCSADDLQQIYFANLQRQFGDSVELTPEFRYEWIAIPHMFSTPFYCYAYSFGQLLVLALYRRYQQDRQGFTPGYLKMLSYGGSARPQEILAEADIDITDIAFWQGGFDVVAELLEQLVAL